MIGISENSQRSYLMGPKGKFIFKKFRIPRNKTLVPGICSAIAKMFEHRNSGKNRKKGEKKSNIGPPGFDSGQKIQNFTVALLKVVFSFFHLQLF
jgi:hypothetical protein